MGYWCAQCKNTIKERAYYKHQKDFPTHKLINEYFTPTKHLDRWNAEHPDDLHNNYLINRAQADEKQLQRVQKKIMSEWGSTYGW